VSDKQPALPSQLDQDVRKAGLGLCIVAALPVFIALIVIRQGTPSKEPYIGFVVGVVLAGLGGLVLARKWPALYFAALLCALGSIGLAVAALKEQKPQGLLLTVGLASAAAYLFKVGNALRAHLAAH
jgi:hypothetical protein